MKRHVFGSLLALIACGEQPRDDQGATGGTLVIAATQDPGSLFPPFVATVVGKQVTEQIYDYLADVGPDLITRGDKGFRPQLADGWKWSTDSLSIAFHINPRARWHDGARVTAHDVVFTHTLNRSPELGGRMESELKNIDSVSTADSLTAVFWFHERLPTQFLDAAAQLLILPSHRLERIAPQALREHAPQPVGSGRFRFREWTPGSSVEIVADTSNYRGRSKLDRVIWKVQPDSRSAITSLLSGDADLFDGVRLEDLADLRKHRNLRLILLSGSDYAFLQFNTRDPRDTSRAHPLFGSSAMRRAISMSIDRAALVKNVFDTLAVVALGPTVRAFPTTSESIPQIPFDSARSRVLLDSLGWSARDAAGIRVKDGNQLKFSVIVPLSSLNRLRMATLLQAQLGKAGIAVTIETMDGAAHGARLASRNFDTSLGSWHLGASPDGTRDGWTAAGLGRDGSNYGSYDNPLFDRQFDEALRAGPENARSAFEAAYATINADAPAVWLYEPKTVIGLDRRFRTSVMRADSWWFDLADWYVSPGERISRDRLPLRR